MSDLIDRQAAVDAFEKELSAKYNRRELAIGFVGIESIIRNLPSVQPNLQPTCNKLATDCIERQSVIDAVRTYYGDDYGIADSIEELIEKLPSAQPERMTNRQWVDFLSAQFDISRTSAKEMLHGMMRWKKEDNFKKMFNGGKT